jgi:AcrR family transcriptional regulator
MIGARHAGPAPLMTAQAERGYSMAVRGAAAAATRTAILRATLELVTEKLTVEIVLADVAERSGVTVQTVLRHFGSRVGLFDAVVEYGTREITEERAAPVGDIPSAVGVIVDHYELRGDWVTSLLGQEGSDARIRGITEIGKRVHLEWVRTVFAPNVSDRSPAARDLLTDLLVVATDVYTWKLLRRDRGLTRATTERAMRVLVESVLAAPASTLPAESE